MKRWAVVICALVCVASLSRAVVAQTEAAASGEAVPTPQEIRVGVYMLNLGKLDVSSGAFTADFYLSLKSDRPIPDNSFEFVNGRAGSMEKLEETVRDGVHEKFYRIQANLNTPIDLKRFPFDSQKMQIIIEDKRATSKDVRYVPNHEESGLDEAITFPGWRLLGWETGVREHHYKVYDEQFAQYVYTVRIGRIPMNSFQKTFLPVIFLMLLVMSSFILNPTQITTRLATISSTLMASAMFHVSISNQIPPVGYLTFADKFMVMTYLILLLSFFLSIGTFVLQGKNQEARVKKLQTLSERLVFGGIPACYGGLFLFMQ